MQTHKVAGVSRVLAPVAVLALSMFVISSVAFAATTAVIMPSANGFYTSWTPSTGTSHFALVDETPCNGTTDYNSTTVVGNRDSYAVSLTAVPDGSTITQVDIKPCASRVSGGGANPVMNVFYRANGVNSSDSGAYALTGTTPVELATTSFASLNVIKSATSTLESGAVLTSSTKGARLSRLATIVTYTPFASPTNLTGTPIGSATSSSIRLNWSNTTLNEAGYVVQRSTDAVNWSSIATTSANAVTYTDTGVTPLTVYYHRMYAYNFAATAAPSNTATTTAPDLIPVAPSGITVSATSSVGTSTYDVLLNWADNSTNETGFTIQRSYNGGTFAHVATTSVDVVSYTHMFQPAGVYVYRVRSFNTSGSSAYTTSASTTIP